MERDTAESGLCAYRVVGRVQGVGFRWWTRAKARELGVGGTVRNEADGSVVVHAIGPLDALARFAEALRAGPASARVDRLEPIAPAEGMRVEDFRVEG